MSSRRGARRRGRRQREEEEEAQEEEAEAEKGEEKNDADGDEEEKRERSQDNDNAEEDEDEEVGGMDEETLRIMISTDNHLGFCERDPIRGLDSFAAFEEMLYLARKHRCDMVLLAGDLFHDNKPSRRTLHKTMEILRRYCWGPNPVQFQILSDPSLNFRGGNNNSGGVNYEDEFTSVDLPVFSIHGNHDDPTRDGGTEMLAALDLLAVTNLVNYFGRQEEVDNVEVSPILMRKGSLTRVALYGMGSMRDERLNRMWQGKKVRFLRPAGGAEEEEGEDNAAEEDEEAHWFNIFALHQNRDLGRGAKNCVHESMIPEWMDLVMWGHEHECLIVPSESAVGTFRITQPGSTVATSLTSGEAVQKHVGLLDVRGSQFRLRPLPLTQVRPFVTGELSLADYARRQGKRLDPEDPKVEDKMADILADRVTQLLEEARNRHEQGRRRRRQQDAAAAAKPPSYQLEKPDQVLIRLRVEHSGFSTLNNQRFGARFVGEVANPSDILLFHRRRQPSEPSEATAKKKKATLGDDPIAPQELEEVNIEDLIRDNLHNAEKKLEILDEQKLGLALEEFVSKEQRQAIGETVDDILKITQDKLIQRGVDEDAEDDAVDDEEGGGGSKRKDAKITTAAAVRELCKAQARKKKQGNDDDDDEDDGDKDMEEEEPKKSRRKRDDPPKSRGRKRLQDDDEDEDDEMDVEPPRQRARKRKTDDDEDDDEVAPPARGRRTATPATARRGVRSRKQKDDELDDIEEDEEDEEPKASTQKRTRGRPVRQAASSARKKGKYVFNDDDEDEEEDAGGDDYVDRGGADENEDDHVIVLDSGDEEEGQSRSRRGGAASGGRSARSGRSTAGTSASSSRRQAQLETYSASSNNKRGASASGRQGRAASRNSVNEEEEDEDSDDHRAAAGSSSGVGRKWGTANGSRSQTRRGRR